MEAILPSASITTVTLTSDWKPFAEAVFSSPSTAGATSSAAGAREFRASIIALEVMVAPDSTSTPSTGRVLPMNWFRKASSSAQRVPKLGVSLEESTLMEAILPSASITTVTLTSDWKPFAEAVFSSPSTAGTSSTTGATNSPVATAPFSTVRLTFTSPVKPSLAVTIASPFAFTDSVAFSPSAITVAGTSPSAGTLARAASTASITALEVTVAPDRASTETGED